MAKNIENMTNQEKRTFYVNKISRLSSDEYKYNVGFWITAGIYAIGLIAGKATELPFMGVGIISAYCGISERINAFLQTQANKELSGTNNESEVKRSR